MRSAVIIMLMLGMIVGLGSNELSGQVTKADPKDKESKEPKQPEWPKKVMNKTLEQWVNDMLIRNQPDSSMRDFAIKTLPLFGPDARKAASKNLIEVLRNEKDINVKLTAISMVPVLGFDERDMDEGLNALMAYVNKNLSQASNHTRYEVTMALGNCGPVARKAIPLLADWTLTDQSSWQNRKAAAFALGRLGMSIPVVDPMAKKDDPPKFSGPDVKAVAALADRLEKDNSHQVRREAVQSLLLLGPPNNEAAWKTLRTALAKCFKDPDVSTQIWAHVTFIRTELDVIKPKDQPTNTHLKAIFYIAEKNEEASHRMEAIQALGTLGNEATFSVNFLIGLATDPRLAKIDDKKATQAERDQLAIAVMAIWALGQMTAEQNRLVPVLTELQKHSNEVIKNAAKEAYTNLVRKDDPKFEGPKKDIKKDIKKP